ncbi:MAG: VOC family protein [Defluviimonas denitrificans]
MLKRIHHVAVICSDYAASKRFYTEVLGLPVLAENHRAGRESWKLDLGLPDGGRSSVFPPRPRARRGPRPAARGTCALPSMTSRSRRRCLRPRSGGGAGTGR